MVSVLQSKSVLHRKKNSDEKEKSSQRNPFDVWKEKEILVENTSFIRKGSKTPVKNKQSWMGMNDVHAPRQHLPSFIFLLLRLKY